MRSALRGLVLTAALCAASPLVSPGWATAAAQNQTARLKSEVNLRVRPDTTSEVKTVLPQGTSVKVVCWTKGEPTFGTDKSGSMWFYLSRGGWVHSKLTTPVNVPPCTGGRVIFANCDDARAAGAAPVYAGSPGYGLHLDRDRDGIGCESAD